jgi:hypothetical protein
VYGKIWVTGCSHTMPSFADFKDQFRTGFFKGPPSWYFEYGCGDENRLAFRCVSSAIVCATILPRIHLVIQKRLGLLLHQFINRPLYLPQGRFACFGIGVAGGALENYAARVAYLDTRHHGSVVEVQLWTFRSLLPACLFFVHPVFAMRILAGEQKGCDVAMAQLESHPYRRWPFFAVQTKGGNEFKYFYHRFLSGGFFQPTC